MSGVGLPEALERAASALPTDADAIRPANGDPVQLLETLGAEAAARVLAWLLAHETEDGAELAEEWADGPEPGAAAILAVDEKDLPKSARKALRRVQHRLRSRGVAVPEEKPKTGVAKLPPVEEALDRALVLPLDPRGARGVYLVSSHPSGGVRMFEVVLDEARGVVDLRVYNTGRGRVRRFLRDFPGVEAPPTAVRALVRRVAAGGPEPRAFQEWRKAVAGAPEDAKTPGELAREALGEPAEREAVAGVRRAVELVRAGELGPWPPDLDALQELVARLEGAGESQLTLTDAQRQEQVDRVLDECLGDLFGGERGALTAARFDEMAYVYWKRGREEDARACLATALAFRNDGPAENPVARALVERVLPEKKS